jgi:hypothetical protein
MSSELTQDISYPTSNVSKKEQGMRMVGALNPHQRDSEALPPTADRFQLVGDSQKENS